MSLPARNNRTKRVAALVLLIVALMAFAPDAHHLSMAAAQIQTQNVSIPEYDDLPTTGETYPGSGVYLVDGADSMNGTVRADQKAMADMKIDVGRLIGLRLGDVIFTLKSGKGKRLAFYERGAYHELNGQVALGSLVLTSIKDGKIVLGTDPDDYYDLTTSQRDYLLNQPVAGEGGLTALTFEGLLDARAFGGTSILNTDPNKAADVLSKYGGKLITEGAGHSIEVKELDDPNFKQEMMLPSPVTNMKIPRGAHDALLRLFNGDEVAILKLVGYPVSPYFVMETQINGVLRKVGVLFTERQVLTYNPDNDAANRWEIGLFGARVFEAVKNGRPTATQTPVASTKVPRPTDTPIAEPPATPILGDEYPNPVPDYTWFGD